MATLHVFGTHQKARDAWKHFETDGKKFTSKLTALHPETGRHIFARVNDLTDAHIYAGMQLNDVIFHDQPDRRAMGYLAGLVR